jgi:hypothetical protein
VPGLAWNWPGNWRLAERTLFLLREGRTAFSSSPLNYRENIRSALKYLLPT